MKEAEDTRQYFDRTAEAFSAKYAASPSFEERRRVWNRCIDMSLGALDGGALCLDVGCGDGSLSRSIVARGYRTVGIDQSTSMLSLARRRARSEGIADNAEYVEGTVPLSPEVVDRFRGKAGLILCSSVLEYVDDYNGVLQQFNAMLCCGGRMIVSVPNRESMYRGVERLIRRVLPTRDSYLRHQRHQFRAGAFKAQLTEMSHGVVHEEYFALPLHGFTEHLLGGYRGRRLATLYVVVTEKLCRRPAAP
jgi:2-polyprenyl-6-hydroxyphenyl methylase/3-demethylubiquinone-9 3-methyltransferase